MAAHVGEEEVGPLGRTGYLACYLGEGEGGGIEGAHTAIYLSIPSLIDRRLLRPYGLTCSETKTKKQRDPTNLSNNVNLIDATEI